MTVKRLIGSAPSQISRNRDLGTMAFQDVSAFKGPTFSAYAGSTQTLANATYTKITFNNKAFDTHSNYDASTNYRFTPIIPGYYQINATVQFYPAGSNAGLVTIYKNGSAANPQIIANTPLGSSIYMCAAASGILYMNGTTDYIECYAYQGSGGNLTVQGNGFSAIFVRGQ